MNVVETRGLTKCFGAICALDRLDLEIEAGEIFGWLGPNGAGKTTTLRLLLDFVRPTHGDARVLNRPTGDASVRGRIGYLPGDLKLDPTYTGAEVIEFFGSLRGGYDKGTLSRLIDRFGFDPTRRIGTLSTGNRRKLGLIQAFMHRPSLLLLDEPTSGLDPLLQHEFNGLLREANQQDGTTVFLSSHVLPEIEALTTRVGILREGRLVSLSTVEALRKSARQRLTFFLASPDGVDDVRRLSQVIELSVVDDRVEVVVEGSLERVVSALAPHGVTRIINHDDDLDRSFLRFYESGEP